MRQQLIAKCLYKILLRTHSYALLPSNSILILPFFFISFYPTFPATFRKIASISSVLRRYASKEATKLKESD